MTVFRRRGRPRPRPFAAAALAAAIVSAMLFAAPGDAQIGPIDPSPPAPAPQAAAAETEPLPSALTLARALDEAEARSPAIIAAQAAVRAAEARVRQAGYRANPELSVEVENFAGTGDLSGIRGVETTISVSQRLDVSGRRGARVSVAQAELIVQRLRLAVAYADLAQAVREHFARAATARDRLRLAEENLARARELARVAGILVNEGRDPPLRALRARTAAAQAEAELETARADESAARGTLAALFGVSTPPASVVGSLLDVEPRAIDPEQSLEVRIADAERVIAEAGLRQEQVGARLDPSVGLGVRHVREIGDTALVAAVTMPLPVFDRNRGNIDAARSNIVAAEARRAAVSASARVRARNAITSLEAAQARVAALETAAIPEAAEALRLTQLSYQAGRSSLLELLDAQNANSAAQAALIDARLAQALATAELGRVSAQ